MIIMTAPGQMACVWPIGACKWCGDIPTVLGAFVDAEDEKRVLLVYACERHSHELTSMLDGLTDGKLARAYQSVTPPQKELH